MKRYIHPFEPFENNNSEILILGTFPSIKSFEENFYYTHSRNQFWRLLVAVFNEKTPIAIEEKIEFFKKYRIALWDVIKSCKRKNSLDSNLKEIEPSNIKTLLNDYPSIRNICFTSKTAQKIYEKYFSSFALPTYYLPSPSPAYRAMDFKQKLQSYKKILDIISIKHTK